MKKIKIIDLLNKVANGEEVPKKIRFEGKIFEKQDEATFYCTGIGIFENVFVLEDLNKKVEIIEEDIKENPTFEEYMENPEKYWNNLLEKLDEIKQYLKND